MRTGSCPSGNGPACQVPRCRTMHARGSSRNARTLSTCTGDEKSTNAGATAIHDRQLSGMSAWVCVLPAELERVDAVRRVAVGHGHPAELAPRLGSEPLGVDGDGLGHAAFPA